MTTVVPDGTEIASGEVRSLPEFRVGDPIVGTTLALRRDPLTTLIEPYRRFGRIFRMRLLGRTVVVMAGVDANEFAWRDADQWAWSASGAVFREQFGPNYLTQLEGPEHAAKRRRLSPAFRPRTLQRQVPAMAEVWLDAIDANAGTVVDLRSLCKRLVVQMAGRALLRVELPQHADEDISRLEHDLLKGAALGWFRRAWFRRPSYRARKLAFTRFLADVVAERRRDWSGDDMMSEILRTLPHGAVIPPVDELVGDAVLLLQAGSESTAHQILWTVLLLQSRPDWLAELREELDGWTVERAADLGAFPKLRATVYESERLRPAIPAAVRVAARDLRFSSHTIPAGATVYHATTLTHFLDELFEDPMSFRPERFLAAGAAEHASRRWALGTYGGGSHSCLGTSLARVQVPLSVALLTKHTDLTSVEPVSLRARFDGVVTPVERTLPTRISRRT